MEDNYFHHIVCDCVLLAGNSLQRMCLKYGFSSSEYCTTTCYCILNKQQVLQCLLECNTAILLLCNAITMVNKRFTLTTLLNGRQSAVRRPLGRVLKNVARLDGRLDGRTISTARVWRPLCTE